MSRRRRTPRRRTPHDRTYRVALRFGFTLFRLLGLRITAVGMENIPESGGAVLAITHFGYLDFAFTECVVWRHNRRFTRFLATSESFRHPISGPLMRAMRHIPVDRTAGGGAYAAATEALRAGQLVGVFPEGSVDRSYTVKSCKTGAVRLAAQAGVPLIPVAVWGGHRVITKGRKISLRERLGVAVAIQVGPPVPVTEGAVVQQTEALRMTLATLIGDAQYRYPQIVESRDDWWLPAHLGGGAPTADEVAVMDVAEDLARAVRRESETAADA